MGVAERYRGVPPGLPERGLNFGWSRARICQNHDSSRKGFVTQISASAAQAVELPISEPDTGVVRDAAGSAPALPVWGFYAPGETHAP